MLYLCLSYDPIWHSAVELMVATAIPPDSELINNWRSYKPRTTSGRRWEMGWGALSARKKQGLKISPKPLFIIRGVPILPSRYHCANQGRAAKTNNGGLGENPVCG